MYEKLKRENCQIMLYQFLDILLNKDHVFYRCVLQSQTPLNILILLLATLQIQRETFRLIWEDETAALSWILDCIQND